MLLKIDSYRNTDNVLNAAVILNALVTHVLSAREKLSACYALIDILYAYAYNHRTTEGDYTVLAHSILAMGGGMG